MITLIEKRGKDKRFIKNWRPISLLNVDIKIASKALAMRLKRLSINLLPMIRLRTSKGVILENQFESFKI